MPFALREHGGRAPEDAGPLAHAKGLELTYDVAPEVPDGIVGGRRAHRPVLLNLVGNAIKFTERGEVAVLVTAGAATADGDRPALRRARHRHRHRRPTSSG